MTDQNIAAEPGLSRRTLVAETCLVAGAVALTGCTVYDTSVEQPAAETPTDAGAAAGPLAAVADVPVGGGLVVKDKKVVLTQPTDGEFKGFSAVCTHQGCLVATVADGTINCSCHGSKFSITDGSVVAGPAKAPLGTASITVDGTQIVSA